MNFWHVKYTQDSAKDREDLSPDVRKQIDKAIRKVSQNPLPQSEGGYGKALGHRLGRNLTGFCKIKLKKLGIRVVYKVIKTDEIMKIIVIAERSEDEVYEIAARRDENR